MCDALVRVLYCAILSFLPMASAETRVTGYRGLSGQRLTGQETFVPARSKIECAVTCRKRSQCFSFLFDAATRTCHLQAVSEPGSRYDVQHVYVINECDDGRYGTFCLNICSPYCNSVCNKLTGECECKPGYMPTMCTQECGNGRWGQNCSNKCSLQCTNMCNAVTGECDCNPGYQPPMCVLECGNRLWGQNCSNNCSTQCTNICNVVTGECTCNTGYQPPLCLQAQCGYGLWGQDCTNTCSPQCINMCDVVTGECTCNLGIQPSMTNFRLANGPTSREGRLEININGTWGTVCDDYFDTNAAIVACRMMGYETTNALVQCCAYFGQGVGPIHLDDVVCFGNESHLLNCGHLCLDTHNCGHSEDVGVICGLK